jgi:hypothetical protein
MSTKSLEDLHEDPEKTAEELAAEELAAKEAEAAEAARIAAEGGKTAEELAAEKAKAEEEAAKNVPGIEQFLSQYNITGGMIELEKEDGTKETKHFNELSPEEQFNVLHDLANSGAPSIESKYGLDEDEIGLINMVRKSGKPIEEVLEDLAQERVSQILALKESTGVDYTKMSDDALISKWIKDNNPEANDAEIAEELARQKASKFYEKNVKSIREQFLTAQKLEADKASADRKKALDDELEEDRRTIATAVAGIDNVAGFKIDNNEKNLVLADLLEVNEEGDSKFMERVFSDPKELFRVAWLAKNAELYFDNMEKHYKKLNAEQYQKGKKDAIDGFSADPVNGTGGTGSGTNPKVVRVENAKSLDELHSED